ncbi:MAG: response regulator [Candidatus Obscuribacterales bacterium]|nr:response regulator [Candidatus Obscuribacterales bacterium]
MNRFLHLLLVTDNHSSALALREKLLEVEGLEFGIAQVSNLNDALEKLSTNPNFDTVLLDLRLPSEALKKIRSQNETIPIITLHSELEIEQLSEFIRDGADSCLLIDKIDGNRIAISILSVMRSKEDSSTKLAIATDPLDKLEQSIEQELVATTPLTFFLEKLVRGLENLPAVDHKISILLIDETRKRLLHGAAPSLPPAYNAAIDGIAIGYKVGSCGTAAFCNHPVYCVDITTDPLWEDFSELAISHGLRACWSIPFSNNNREVIGTFAIYYDKPKFPTAAERQYIHRGADIASRLINAYRSLPLA